MHAEAFTTHFGRVDPRNDTERSVEERESKVHSHHTTELCTVVGIEILPLDGIDKQSCSETSGRNKQRLNSADLIQDGKTNSTPHDGQSSADANNQKRLAG